MRDAVEAAEDRGYRNAVNDIIRWHLDEIVKLNRAIQSSSVEVAPGRSVTIGVMWEGKFASPSDLVPIVHYHTEMLKVLEEKFVR